LENNKRDKNYPILLENLERLHALRTPAGKKIQGRRFAHAETLLV
jgi:hypothetical protein